MIFLDALYNFIYNLNLLVYILPIISYILTYYVHYHVLCNDDNKVHHIPYSIEV